MGKILLCACWILLSEFVASIYDIVRVSDPVISWSNINFGSPVIKIYFSSPAEFNDVLPDFWIKLSLPFYVNTIQAQWAIDNCGSSQVFSPAAEERVSVTNEYTEFYVQFLGAKFQRYTTYILRIVPNPYMDYLGYSNPVKMALISRNMDNYLFYAYNNALFHFLGTPSPNNDLIIKDLFKDKDCYTISRNCSQIVKVKFSTTDSIYRIVIELKGDYLFDDFNANSCWLLENSSYNSTKIPKNYYTCYLSENFGTMNRYLVYESSIVLKPGNYYLNFITKTPSTIGSHSYRIFIMDKYSSTILSYAEILDQFKAQPFSWEASFPQLKFSMGFNASDTTLPYYLGLYSTSTTYNQVLNTLTFYVKAKELPTLKEDEYLSVKVYLGLPNPIFPLGQVRDNFGAAPNKEKTYKRIDDHLMINNIVINLNQTYTITYKIGFTEAIELNSSSDSGFGVIQILKNGNVVVSGKTNLKFGFTKVLDNKNIFLPESVDQTAMGYYRGYSAFRSAPSSQLLNNPVNYKLNPNNHGLRIGDNQEFYFQSSVGSIKLYTPSVTISALHNSARSFLQIVTHPSIRSKATSFPDSSAQSNCKFYSCIFSKWSNQFTINEAQTVLDPTLNNVITVQPPSYNPISGCSYAKIDYNANGKLSYSRFRMRFQDLMCQNQNGDPCSITGVKLAFSYSMSQLVNAPQQNGNYFVFNNIDIVDTRGSTEFNSDFYVLDAFVHLYYFSNIFQTDQVVTSIPNILMMDNLYILNDSSNSYVSAADLNMFIQNMYYTVSAGTRTINDNSQFPAIVQIYGKFNNLNANTAQIKIFFEAMEPLTVDDTSTKVDCQSQGMKVKGCTIEHGLSEMQQMTYNNVALQNAQLFYLNFKYTTALVINVDPNTIIDSNSLFVLAFPVRLINTQIIESYLLTSTDTMASFPAFQFIDGMSQTIQRVDYGSIGTFFNLYSYSPSYIIPAVTTLTPTQVNTIYDSITANEPAKYFKITYSNNNSGKFGNLQYQVQGAGFKKLSTSLLDFHSTTFCSDYNFVNTTFTADGSTGTKYYSKCQAFKYLNRYCFYCAEIESPVTTVVIKNIIMPSSNGLLWPANTVSLISNKIPIVMMDHSLENNIYDPNLIVLDTSEIIVPLSGLSFKLTIKIHLSNDLAQNAYIIVQKVTGDFRFVLKGDNSKPFCSIRQKDLQSSCFFQISSQSILIQTYSPLAKTDLITIDLFGLSTEGPVPSTDLSAEVFTAIDSSLSQKSKIDSTLPDKLAIKYTASTVSGSLVIQDISISPRLNNALVDVSFTLSLKDRSILPNDAIYIDFGCDCLTKDSLILPVDPVSNKLITQMPSIEVVSAQEILIGDILNFNQKSFKLNIWSFNMTYDSSTSISSQYTFNYGFLAFKSAKANYPDIYDLPQSQGNSQIKFSGSGFKSGLSFNLKPYYTVKETDIIFIRFMSANMPSLSNFPLYAFESNFGSNKLNIWIQSPFVIGINGFQNEFDANRFFNFWIYGLQLPSEESSALVIVTGESGMADPKEKALITIPPSIETQYISEVVVHKLLFSPRNLRVKGKLGFRMSFPKALSRSQSLVLNLDHIYRELLKPISPQCSLYQISKSKFTNYTEYLTMDPGSGSSINANFTANLSLINDIFGPSYSLNYCKLLGNSLEINLGQDVGTETVLVVDGLPTPDQSSCRLVQPTIIVTNAKNTKILMSSSAITSNAQGTTFENYRLRSTIGYKNSMGSQTEIIRGFYEIVTLSIDFSPQQIKTFQKQLTFVLINNEDGRFVSQNSNPKNGKVSQTEIGSETVDLVIGADEQTSVFVYPLVIMKQELSPFLYTDPPVLNAKVIAQTMNLIYPTNIVYVYRGGYSLPIIIRSPKYPINEQYFTLNITGEAASDIRIKDEMDEFLLSFSNSAVILTLEGLSNTNWVEATLEIKPMNMVLFNPARIRLMVIHEDSKLNNFNMAVIRIQETTADVKFDSQNQVYVCFYVAPISFNYTLPQTYIETMIKAGASVRNGVFFKADVLTDVTNPLTISLDSLYPNNEYRLFGYYTIPSQNLKGNYTETFLTRAVIN